MKKIRTIIILLVLFGLPAGSWYFLKFGFNWRKDKLETLTSKGNLIQAIKWGDDEKEYLYGLMTYKTTVVKTNGPITETDQLIIDQFRKSHSFQWLTLTRDTINNINLSTKDVRKYYTSRGFYNQPHLYSDVQYMLIDTSLQIRNVYPDDQSSTMDQLIEDIAIILPRKQAKDISIRKKQQ